MLALDRYLGLPYAEGGRGPAAYDCLGLAIALLEEQRGRAPRILAEVAGPGEARDEFVRIDAAAATEGDLVLFRSAVRDAGGRAQRAWHLGVVLTRGDFVHAVVGQGVAVASLRSPAWRNRIEGFYRWA